MELAIPASLGRRVNPAVLVAVCAGGFAAAVIMIVAGIRGRDLQDAPFRGGDSRLAAVRTRARLRVTLRRTLVAAAIGLAVWLLTGWPVAGLLSVGLTLGVPYFFGASRVARRRIERQEALEEWSRRLAETLAVGGSPVQTIVRSAEHAPKPIAKEVTSLANALATPRLDRTVALQAFADEIDDAVGDMVTSALKLAVSMQSSSRLPDVLRTMAVGVAEQVQASRAIEVMRAGPRSESRAIVIVQIVFLAAVAMLTDYMAPYGTLLGQLVLAVIGGVMLLALWLLRRFSMSQPVPRFLTSATVPS
jgi:tight adherence protein B